VRSRRALLGQAVAASVSHVLSAADDRITSQQTEALDGAARGFHESHSIPALSIAIARKGELIYAKGFGFADLRGRETLTPAHLFRIASISKPITSVAVFSLMEQGRLRLDDRVFGPEGILRNDYGAPPYRQYVGDVRIRHLLTHTAGGWQNDHGDPMFRNPQMNHQQLITWALAECPLTNPPGQHFAYSNFGYCVLGRVIEKITRQPYDQYVQAAILERCGIHDMRIAGNTLRERAHGEVVYAGVHEKDPYTMNVRRMDSHGGWLANASDLARFAMSLEHVLTAESIREMTTATSANPGYAKGWAVNATPNWWHNGSLPGTTTLMVRTASGFCWSALANVRPVGTDLALAMDRMMWELSRLI